ncbi:MAG: SET domain-containing protein-lysine N-methyltransferase [Xanthomonadales bacterium]|nr:SET domain-containing protein-lysine N-methyltransferase [Xanthomonadales bacterium]
MSKRRIRVRNSRIHGRGVFAAVDLEAEIPLIRYRGRLRSHDDADQLYDGSLDSGHTFLFTLNDQYVVDGNHDSNSARWINHSCDPNCETIIHESADGDPRRDEVWVYTLRDIAAGEELSFNYGIVLSVRHTARMKAIWACHCGANNCTGTMLQPKPR